MTRYFRNCTYTIDKKAKPDGNQTILNLHISGLRGGGGGGGGCGVTPDFCESTILRYDLARTI